PAAADAPHPCPQPQTPDANPNAPSTSCPLPFLPCTSSQRRLCPAAATRPPPPPSPPLLPSRELAAPPPSIARALDLSAGRRWLRRVTTAATSAGATAAGGAGSASFSSARLRVCDALTNGVPELPPVPSPPCAPAPTSSPASAAGTTTPAQPQTWARGGGLLPSMELASLRDRRLRTAHRHLHPVGRNPKDQ
ncbi:unnamed protein product, partial [Urochloa humidicola]